MKKVTKIKEQDLFTGTYLDFNKITKYLYAVIIILSERGWKGKSYNAKEFLFDRYKKDGSCSGWIFNTRDLIKETYHTFLRENIRENAERWENVVVSQKGLRLEGEKFEFLLFLALGSTAQNKMKRTKLEWIFYDEFNEQLSTVRKGFNHKLDLLMFSFAIPAERHFAQLLVFGNNKSLNHPLLSSFDIVKIPRYVLTEDVEKNKTVLLYVPKGQKELIDNPQNDVGWEKASRKMKQYKHSIGNVNLDDITSNILAKSVWLKNKDNWLQMDEILTINGNYYRVFISKEGENHYIYNIDLDELRESKRPQITSKMKYAEDNVSLNNQLKYMFCNLMENKLLKFDSLETKEFLIKHW